MTGVLELNPPLNGMKFNVGEVFVTSGIQSRIKEDSKFADFVGKSFTRHCDGDWGNLCEEDKAMNDRALANGDDRMLSRYDYNDEKIYIITEWHRQQTTILFANEY